MRRLQECAAVASQFGALLVVGQMQGFLSDEPDQSKGEARIESCLKRVVEAAEQYGTTIAFEPVNHLQAGFHNTLEAVMALARRIDSPRFKPMLDSFHMNIEEVSLTEPIYQAGRDLAHFHLCESNGGFLGSGHLNLAADVRRTRENRISRVCVGEGLSPFLESRGRKLHQVSAEPA